MEYDSIGAVWPPEIGAYCEKEFAIPDTFDYRDNAQRFEYGTRDTASVAAIRKAIEFLSVIGMKEVEERGRFLGEYLRSALADIPGTCTLFTFTHAKWKKQI